MKDLLKVLSEYLLLSLWTIVDLHLVNGCYTVDWGGFEPATLWLQGTKHLCVFCCPVSVLAARCVLRSAARGELLVPRAA